MTAFLKQIHSVMHIKGLAQGLAWSKCQAHDHRRCLTGNLRPVETPLTSCMTLEMLLLFLVSVSSLGPSGNSTSWAYYENQVRLCVCV